MLQWCRYAGRYDLNYSNGYRGTWIIDGRGNVTSLPGDGSAATWAQLVPHSGGAECPETPCARVGMQYPGYRSYAGYLWVAGAGSMFRLRDYWEEPTGDVSIFNTSGTVDVIPTPATK